MASLRYTVRDFKPVTDKKGKKLLQFTRVWQLKHPILGEHGDTIQYCLAMITDGQLKWNPPLNYFAGGGSRKQLHSMHTPTYNGILEALRKSKHIKYLESPLDVLEEDSEETIEVEV